MKRSKVNVVQGLFFPFFIGDVPRKEAPQREE
jgi:hypothetical protein